MKLKGSGTVLESLGRERVKAPRDGGVSSTRSAWRRSTTSSGCAGSQSGGYASGALPNGKGRALDLSLISEE